MSETMTAALSKADRAIERAAKIEAAIAAGVMELPGLIDVRLNTDGAFRRAESGVAIGEQPYDGLKAARKAADEAEGALKEAQLRLDGFRRARGTFGPDLCAAYDALKAALPEHEGRVVADFTREWNAAATAFSIVLGRRAGIEKLLGVKMELSDPVAVTAAAAELAEMGRPYERLSQLQAAIERIQKMQSASKQPDNARHHVLPGSSLAHYDPAGVYVIVRNGGFMGQPYHSKVVDATYDHGWLEFLVLAGDTRAVRDLDEPGVLAAAAKVKEIEQEAKRKRENAEQEEARIRAGLPQPSRRDDLERLAERYDDTAERELKNRQIGNRSSSPSDQAFGAH
jgi:hypothetical protein